MTDTEIFFDELSRAFLDSFISQPSATFHPSLQLTNLESLHRGRGIVATSDITADSVLFTIPRCFVISVSSSKLFSELPQLFRQSDDVSLEEKQTSSESSMDDEIDDEGTLMPKPWLDLILVLLYEYFHRSTSKWKTYWDVLPDKFDTLMFWTDSELSELQSSAVRGRIGKESADKMFKSRILPVIKANEDVFYPDHISPCNDQELLGLAHRMGSLIMSYAFDLENSNDDDTGDADADGNDNEDGWAEDRESDMAMGMVPMADMLNADAEFNAHLEHGEDVLTMRSLREIKKGEEVLNYYGPLPNSDLLRRYGYTSQLHARYDVVEISWDLIRQALSEITREVCIPTNNPALEEEAEDEDLEETFMLERDAGDPDEHGALVTQATFAAFPEELIDQVTVSASKKLGIDSKSKLSGTDKRRLKTVFLETMARALPRRQAQYATSLAQDTALLQGSPDMRGRLRMAVDVRMGEKKLLAEAVELVKHLLAKYADVEVRNGAEGPLQKKLKVVG